MKLSTRARYGMRLMAVLAQEYGNAPVFLKNIAAGEQISEKYLSLIVIPLRAAGLIKSLRGAHGGYELARNPDQITMLQVMEALEGKTCLVNCVEEPDTCNRAAACPTRDIWKFLGNTISKTLDGITLAKLIKKKPQWPGRNAIRNKKQNGGY